MLKVEFHKWSEPGEYQAESALADKMKGPEMFPAFSMDRVMKRKSARF